MISDYHKTVLKLIQSYEGLGPNQHDGVAYPYQGAGDRPRKKTDRWPYTCGWGHLMSDREEHEGVVIDGKLIDVMELGLTLEQANSLLLQDFKPMIAIVESALKHADSHELGAFLDLVFNAGPECLYLMPGHLHRAGNKKAAASSMLKYFNARGRGLLGLWRRRLSDAVFYLSGELIIANSPISELKARNRLEALLGGTVYKPSNLQ